MKISIPVYHLSQPNYSYGCFVVEVAVVVGLWQLKLKPKKKKRGNRFARKRKLKLTRPQTKAKSCFHPNQTKNMIKLKQWSAGSNIWSWNDEDCNPETNFKDDTTTQDEAMHPVTEKLSSEDFVYCKVIDDNYVNYPTLRLQITSSKNQSSRLLLGSSYLWKINGIIYARSDKD